MIFGIICQVLGCISILTGMTALYNWPGFAIGAGIICLLQAALISLEITLQKEPKL